MFIFLEYEVVFRGSNDQFMGPLIIHPVFHCFHVDSTDVIPLSLYQIYFLNICRNTKHIVFLSLLAKNAVISAWVYFLKNITHDLSLQRFTIYVLLPMVT